MSDIQEFNEIKELLVSCVAILGGESDILCLIGSWEDTLSPSDIKDGLQVWIKTKLAAKQKETTKLREFCNR